MDLLFPFHPRLVHFPIALSLVGVALLLGAILRGVRRGRPFDQGDRWLSYGRFSLVLGWLGTLAAVASGLVDQSRAPDTPAVAAVIDPHITAGLALFVLLGLAIYWPLKDKRLWTERGRQMAYMLLLISIAGLVLFEGWLGGKLVYDLGVGAR